MHNRIQAVLAYLEGKGFKHVQHTEWCGFEWSTNGQRTKARLDYSTSKGFHVSTTCADWTVEEAEQLQQQLATAITDAKYLNSLLAD